MAPFLALLLAHPLPAVALTPDEVSPQCQLLSTGPIPEGGGAAPVAAVAKFEQVLSCNGDIGVVDYFDAGERLTAASAELARLRWGGPTPPARLHDQLLRKGSVLADVSGSRATSFRIATKLSARGFASLSPDHVDFAEIEQAMGASLESQAPPLQDRPREAPEAPTPGGVAWLSWDEALHSGKPICLTLYTTWCPHCRNFRKLFADPRVIEKSRDFAMVEVDAERNPQLSARYAPDGQYIPRTFFLDSDGRLDGSIAARSRGDRFVYSEFDPRPLLESMDLARRKLH